MVKNGLVMGQAYAMCLIYRLVQELTTNTLYWGETSSLMIFFAFNFYR